MQKVTIITHNGKFHADDIFAVAVLRLMHSGDTVEVVRTRDRDVIAQGDYVVDVGGEYDAEHKRFDHHQPAPSSQGGPGGAGERGNGPEGAHLGGIPYASFGLVWKEYGDRICNSEDVALEIERKLVQYIDAIDNGVSVIEPLLENVYPYTIFDVFDTYAPTWKETSVDMDSAFTHAVGLAQHIIEREILRARHLNEAIRNIEDAYNEANDKRIVVLNEPYPAKSTLHKYEDVLFVVRPDIEGKSWHVSTMKQDEHSFSNRKDFPKSWAGLKDEELQNVTGVPDALFCHNARFLAVAKTKNGAIALATLAVNS